MICEPGLLRSGKGAAMTGNAHPRQLSAETVKAAATGRWPEILEAVAGIPQELLDGKGHPCPRCGGKDRFSLIDKTAGAVLCRHCFSKRNGDGLAAVGWMQGCEFDTARRKVAEYLGLETASTNGKPRIVAEYNYPDESGTVLFQAVRKEPGPNGKDKTFFQRRPNLDGGWINNVEGVRVVPYRLPELQGGRNEAVYVPEGEKDVDNLAALGLLATCNVGGAGKWTAEHAEYLRGRDVVVLPDNDKAGEDHAQQVALSLLGVAKSVRIVELPNLPDKGDVSDWLAAGGTREELQRLAEAAPLWTPRAQPWPEIRSFDASELPEFPTAVLPSVLRSWVEAESEATQTPADLAGLLALAVCGAAIAKRVHVRARESWPYEPVNIFTAILLPPGNRKSAVFSDATKPLREFESDLIEAARPRVAHAQSEQRQAEARLKKLEKQAAEKQGQEAAEARHEATVLAAQLAEAVEPVLPRLFTDNATGEKLSMMLQEHNGRMASMSSEGGVFDVMGGLYSKNGMAQFDVYLKGHAGDDLIEDRVSRESVRVKHPALTCAYAIQPAVIEGLANKVAFRGRGLLARFLYAKPYSQVGRRKIAPEPMPEAVHCAYHQGVQKLAQVEGEFALCLTKEAAAALETWETEVETMLRDGEQMELIRDWGSKLVGATLRLAAIMHCVERGVAGRIDGRTFAAAVTIARYLIPHAEFVLNFMAAADGIDDDAQYVLRWIENEQSREFSRRDAHQHGRRRFPKVDDLDPALAELVRRGYIRRLPVTPGGPGRPPSPEYEVNPEFFENSKPQNCTHNPHNSAQQPIGGNSEDIEDTSAQSEIRKRVRVTL